VPDIASPSEVHAGFGHVINRERAMMHPTEASRRFRYTTIVALTLIAFGGIYTLLDRRMHSTPAGVRIDSTTVAGITNGLTILMYAEGDATVQFGAGDARRLTDTLRLITAPDFTVDVSRGAVHLEMVAGQVTGGGVIGLRGARLDDSTGRERTVSGAGRHLVIERGGHTIRVVDRGNPRLLAQWR
jgi:hypothetical protein